MHHDEIIACENLQLVLHNEIPLTQTIQISVTQCNQNKVELRAPLAPNINHKCTAFGGSLYCVAVLCGWGFIYHQMQTNKLTGHIVIQKSEVNYKKPVDGEIKAICELEDDKNLKSALNHFLKTYQRKNRARLKLQIKILFKGEEALLFNGQYVVHS